MSNKKELMQHRHIATSENTESYSALVQSTRNSHFVFSVSASNATQQSREQLVLFPGTPANFRERNRPHCERIFCAGLVKYLSTL